MSEPRTTARRARWRDRDAVFLDNGVLEAVVLPGGGHLASLALKAGRGAGVNPLWSVPWASMEPRAYDPAVHDAAYGGPPEGRLLASIMGHNLCLDWFGGPSGPEVAAGLGVHGEAPVATWDFADRTLGDGGAELTAVVDLPHARFRMTRTVRLPATGAALTVETEVRNVGAAARDFGWQEHATFGAPFVEPGVTRFDASATRGRTNPVRFATSHYLVTDAEFAWPLAPGLDGKPVDVRTYPDRGAVGEFTTQLMDPASARAWMTAENPRLGLRCRYRWNRADYPWMGMWDECRDRQSPPWAGKTVCRGMEFGLWPYPQGREAMRKLGSLFGEPAILTLAAGASRRAAFTVELESA